MSVISLPPRSFLIELDDMPVSLPDELEMLGAASYAARTVEGLYVEPLQSLAVVLGVIEKSGAMVFSVRAMAPARAWQRRPEPKWSHSRLRNPISPCWLPTMSPA